MLHVEIPCHLPVRAASEPDTRAVGCAIPESLGAAKPTRPVSGDELILTFCCPDPDPDNVLLSGDMPILVPCCPDPDSCMDVLRGWTLAMGLLGGARGSAEFLRGSAVTADTDDQGRLGDTWRLICGCDLSRSVLGSGDSLLPSPLFCKPGWGASPGVRVLTLGIVREPPAFGSWRDPPRDAGGLEPTIMVRFTALAKSCRLSLSPSERCSVLPCSSSGAKPLVAAC